MSLTSRSNRKAARHPAKQSGLIHKFSTFSTPKLFYLAVLISVSASAWPQTIRLPFTGSVDQEIEPIGPNHQPLGQQDVIATDELAAYEALLGAAHWVGLTATTSLSYADSTSTLPGTLEMLPGNRTRFMVTESGKHNGWVYNGWRSAEIEDKVKTISISARTAAAGFAPFDVPVLSNQMLRGASVLEEGRLSVEGRVLHKIRIEIPIPENERKRSHDATDRATLDAYFDPETHELIKTASWIAIPGSNRIVLFRVTTYSNYKTFDLFRLPTTISESVNGQAIWSLNVDSVDFKNLPHPDTFNFWKY